MVAWDAFDVDNTNLESVGVDIETGVSPRLPDHPRTPARQQPIPAFSGTELFITELRQTWTKEDIDELVEELSTLVAPFKEDADFQISVVSDVPDAFSGIVESSLTTRAPLELEASLERGIVTYRIVDRTGEGAPQTHWHKRRWVDLVARTRGTTGTRGQSGRKSGAAEDGVRGPQTGPVRVKLYYLPQHVFSERPSGLSLADVRDRAVGVRIYRDSVRVRPYGDMTNPEGDWLGLAARKGRDPAGVSRKTYRIPPTQLAGAVLLSRDRNRNLEDSSGREGLIHGDAFFDLRALVLGCLTQLEQYRHERYTEKRPVKAPPPVLRAVEEFSSRLKNAEREWKGIRREIASDPVEATSRAQATIG